MFKRKLSIFLLSLMPIYMVPVLSMHVCMGQEHHHGNCDGEMGHDNGEEEKRPPSAYQFEKAEHLTCFELQKENNPCLYCKIQVPVQQVALLVACLSINSNSGQHFTGQVYQPPPNKEPPTSVYCIRPPPFSKG